MSTDLAGDYLFWGPPGCGKTTMISRQVAKLVEEYGPYSVLIASLTRAAAAEVAGRDIGIPRDQIGTCHSQCYRALGHPELTEKHIDEWNSQVHDRYKLTNSTGSNIDDSFPEQSGRMNGDQLLQEVGLYRVSMIPENRWSQSALLFHQLWENWKNVNGYFDFVDLIYFALRDVDHAPGNPDFIIIDESQDTDVLTVSLIRKWGEKARAVIYAGDPWQCIYAWRGSSPDALSYITDPGHIKILSQSYRLPNRVRDFAMRWMRGMSTYRDLEFKPRDFEGKVSLIDGLNYKSPRSVVELAEAYRKLGKRVMILASCGYQIHDIVDTLKGKGIPFHNPYRTRRGDWNPLRVAKGTSTAEKILAFMKPDNALFHNYTHNQSMWSVEDLQAFVDLLPVDGIMTRGARKQIQELDPRVPKAYSLNDLSSWFTPEAAKEIIRLNLGWFTDNIAKAKKKVAKYPLDIIKFYGAKELDRVVHSHKDTEGMIIPGTIHSCKGGEADIVILVPDLSTAGMAEWMGSDIQRDSIYRLMYVGLTRAKEELVLLGNATDLCVQWPSLV